MARRLVTAVYWLMLGLNALFWLVVTLDQRNLTDAILPALLGLIPFGILPVIRWVRTGEWYADPR